MVQTEQITFYGHPYSPFSHRVHLALEEANADYTYCTINSHDQPEWYVEKVNPLRKIPAMTYGGPRVAPSSPSDASVKLRESLVMLEFLADLFPHAGLLPTDAAHSAQARLFMRVADSTLYAASTAYFVAHAPAKTLLDALAALQAALPAHTRFAAGDAWSIADMAAAPFVAVVVFLLEHDFGTYPAGEGARTLARVRGERFARLNRWFEDVRAQPSFKATWDEVCDLLVPSA
ncbi:glutathione transferase omega [Phanerochaete sordida]|uniref:Glutathione transferase omega n=1 Tax=Phanerochaete sordida TaxID=48140 RepID=A0A9P3LJ32_9APHY|nr:glutathione transferase omega [Phanerochaete sordida]